MRTSGNRVSGARAFTVLEMLVACVVLAAIGLILVQITDHTAKTWRYTSSKSEQFQEARTAFETMTNRISQATLNTYWDYDNAALPTRYERRSELRFISGPAAAPTALLGNTRTAKRVTHCAFFHAPLGFVDDTQSPTPEDRTRGLEGLLNIWGYFVELGDDSRLRPAVLSQENLSVPLKTRFRLMEMMAPSSKLQTYRFTSGLGIDSQPKGKTYTGRQWFQNIANSAAPETHVLAENIVALILHPELSSQDKAELIKTQGASAGAELAENYLYDTTVSRSNRFLNSKDQLPPVMRVTMVAIDEASAQRLNLTGNSEEIFGLQEKFQRANMFRQDLHLDPLSSEDASLENKLVALKVNYRVFTTAVPIRAAKWSQNQFEDL